MLGKKYIIVCFKAFETSASLTIKSETTPHFLHLIELDFAFNKQFLQAECPHLYLLALTSLEFEKCASH